MKRTLAQIFVAALVVAAASVVAQDRSGRGGTGRGGLPPTKAAPAAKARSTTPRIEHISEDLEKAYVRMSEQLQQPLPKRAYHVVTGPAKKTKLFKADPKLLENKFLVTLVLITNKSDAEEGSAPPGIRGGVHQTDWQMANTSSDSRSRRDVYPEELANLIRWGNNILFSPTMGVSFPRQIPLSQRHKELLEHCSPDEQPKGPAVDFLLSADCDRDVRVESFLGERPTRLEGWEYKIYAPSVEEAEQRAAAVLQLLDAGICRPMQRYHLAEGRKALEETRKRYEVVATRGAALRAEEEKLAKPSEISPDILSQLKAQKVMVAVELAGLNARVKACDEMLKDPAKLQVSALQSISDMKVKAEVERVGIKEKLDQINSFIDEGDNRQSIRDRVEALKSEYNDAYSAARSVEVQAARTANLFDLYQPLPLKDDQITINPVEWTN